MSALFDFNPIGPESASELSPLCTASFVQAFSEQHSEQDMLHYCQSHYSEAELKRQLSEPNTSAIIVRYDAKAAGFLTVKHHPCPFMPTVTATELKQLYVLNEYYGSGLGKALFIQARKLAFTAKSEHIWLVVSDKNPRAKAFYSKLGFSPLGPGPELIVGADTLSSTIMSTGALDL